MSFQTKKPESYDFLVKVVIVGDSAVGKTNILLRQVNQQYKMLHTTTIGVDFKIKTISVENKRIKMQIWDTAGQERYRTITATYFKGAAGVILVYSVNDRKSFKNIECWLKQITQAQSEEVAKVIVANKCDCTQQERQVTFQEGKELAERYNLKFIECSAKLNLNINEIFKVVAAQIKYKKVIQQESTMKLQKLVPNHKKPLLKAPCEC